MDTSPFRVTPSSGIVEHVLLFAQRQLRFRVHPGNQLAIAIRDVDFRFHRSRLHIQRIRKPRNLAVEVLIQRLHVYLHRFAKPNLRRPSIRERAATSRSTEISASRTTGIACVLLEVPAAIERSGIRVAIRDHAGERRGDARVARERRVLLLVRLRHFKLLLRRGELRFRAGHLRRALQVFRLRVVHFLLCDESRARIRSLLQAHVGRMRRGLRRLRPLQISLRLSYLVLRGSCSGVGSGQLRRQLRYLEHRDGLPLLDVVAHIDVDRADVARDLRVYVDVLKRLELTGDPQRVAEASSLHSRDRRRRSRTRFRTTRRLGISAIASRPSPYCCGRNNQQSRGNDPSCLVHFQFPERSGRRNGRTVLNSLTYLGLLVRLQNALPRLREASGKKEAYWTGGGRDQSFTANSAGTARRDTSPGIGRISRDGCCNSRSAATTTATGTRASFSHRMVLQPSSLEAIVER